MMGHNSMTNKIWFINDDSLWCQETMTMRSDSALFYMNISYPDVFWSEQSFDSRRLCHKLYAIKYDSYSHSITVNVKSKFWPSKVTSIQSSVKHLEFIKFQQRQGFRIVWKFPVIIRNESMTSWWRYNYVILLNPIKTTVQVEAATGRGVKIGIVFRCRDPHIYKGYNSFDQQIWRVK